MMKLAYTFRVTIVTSMLVLVFTRGQAQIVDDDESRLYAESKQVNQFFRRFNGEEDEKGNRYYESDKLYHSSRLRKKYLEILFDESNKGISSSLKNEFSKSVLDKPGLLDFH